MIEGRVAYKHHLTSNSVHNANQIHEIEGFKLIIDVAPTLG